MNDADDEILLATGLRKSYRMGLREVEVLRGIDVRVRRGEALVIVGASGAGKSTLLHLLGGLDSPTQGDVRLNGASLLAMSNTLRTRTRNERIGFVFQSYNLLPELDALENVCLPSLMQSRSRAGMADRAMDLLRAVGLAERVEHRPW